MRTIVTLDPDVQALLETAMRERGVSFKEALNEAVRAGLSSSNGKTVPFDQKTFSMGWDPSVRWDKALAVADAMEDEEIVRKMSLLK